MSPCAVQTHIHSYNKEIAKFIEEINIKYGFILDYTVLEISEVPHWVETHSKYCQDQMFNRKPNQHKYQLQFFSSPTTGKCRFKSPTG